MKESPHELLSQLVIPACLLSSNGDIIDANSDFWSLLGKDQAMPLPASFHSVINFPRDIQRIINELCTLANPFKARNIPLPAQTALQSATPHAITLCDISGIPLQDATLRGAMIIFSLSSNTAYQPTGTSVSGRAAALRISRKQKNLTNRSLDALTIELDMARSIQEGLLPGKLPPAINMKAAAIFIPAGKIGGDFYDMVITKNQLVAVLIFDVSGHGVPAAIIGAMAKMLFIQQIERHESPARIFTEVNGQICQFVKGNHYLTAFLGFINPLQNTMIYSIAGHVPPVHYHAASNSVSVLDGRSFFIGHNALAGIADYADQNTRFEAGDKFILYTDGLTEGVNKRNTLYGEKRLCDCVKKQGALEPQLLLNEILNNQKLFRKSEPLRDDFTMVCLSLGDPLAYLAQTFFSAQDHPRALTMRTYDDIEPSAAVILREMDKNGFSDRDIKRMKICLYEMCTNSLIHGNNDNPLKQVIMLLSVTPDRVKVSIIDEGEGFNWQEVPSPLAPENILKDHGRGIFIVRRYTDELQFNDKGNISSFVKYRSSPDAED